MNTSRLYPVLTLILAIGACGEGPEATTATHTLIAPVIYGDDDRQEIHAAPPEARAAADSVVALIAAADVTAEPDGRFRIATPTTLGESKDLCAGEPYADQPDSAFCSGFQVADDVIATAGHCVVDAADCADTAIVFGFVMNSDATVRDVVDAADVYHCAEVIDRSYGSYSDWALIRTDRPIVGHGALAVRADGMITDGSPLALIGHPMGLPMKAADGAEVRVNDHPAFFGGNIDAFAGNSGSPVFSADYAVVEGVLVRGEPDLERTGKGKKACNRVVVCPDEGCPDPGLTGFDEATRTTEFAWRLGPPPPPCSDDAFEDNDDDSEAHALSPGDGLSATICAGDSDWYAFWVEAGAVLEATITFDGATSDLDLELRTVVLTLEDSSTGSGDSETVSHEPRSYAGTLYLIVEGLGAAQGAYTLTTTVTTPPPPSGDDCGDGVCGSGESCDGRASTAPCAEDCPGRTGGKPSRRYCWVEGACEGPGC